MTLPIDLLTTLCKKFVAASDPVCGRAFGRNAASDDAAQRLFLNHDSMVYPAGLMVLRRRSSPDESPSPSPVTPVSGSFAAEIRSSQPADSAFLPLRGVHD